VLTFSPLSAVALRRRRSHVTVLQPFLVLRFRSLDIAMRVALMTEVDRRCPDVDSQQPRTS
jgi:hypothetical protein